MSAKNNYPYQDSFENNLLSKDLSKVTIDEYNKILAELFNYLSEFNKGYQSDHRVENLFNRDIEAYLNMLLTNRQISNSTYNKILSHINVYFNYLFTHNLNSNLPTIELKGLKKASKEDINVKWINELDSILMNNNVHFYARMTMLLTSKGYKSEEFLQKGFYKQLSSIDFNENELKFKSSFDEFIKPIQEKQSSSDIFLKQRLSEQPNITIQGLHKYLKPSEDFLNISLNPSTLFQSYIVFYIQKNPNLNDIELSTHLNLDLSSINYYKQLAYKLI
ncbi:phage integrase N-terminal SAM-like domain-containing protein [Apilactobacillus apinorum]|uniref:phage integrase N-terminal SAM-like domain-containing protein n=1 Tax=Apilactobacillus apinorum TaxID=1218495 RepID=UPI0006B64B46|nr:phage integrase N-terminal SAM-like domain-containing protein [Apilactobacillus apinorum]KOY68897.1 Site-specific recombinase XerD [Apilactobacillus apinorum]CAI2673533.1 Site-specific recombinase XerD [Apilactobacillus apinorum]